MVDSVRLVEVGPRDGLQNEKKIIPTGMKVAFINALIDSGLQDIEVTSVVSPKWVPQLADSELVFKTLAQVPGVAYSVLVPNQKGFERACAMGVKRMAFITAASETFSQRNTACSVSESVNRVAVLVDQARSRGISSRVYVSCVAHCPYEGVIAESAVVSLVSALQLIGVSEVSLGDTTGSATPERVGKLLMALKSVIAMDQCAVHFHDTHGYACQNIDVALEHGVRVIDSSAAGLGGCPYAPGASGNVATEQVVSLLQKRGVKTNIDLNKLKYASLKIRQYLSDSASC